jgi:hypothetical protein
VLLYTSGTLGAPMELLGPVEAELVVSSTSTTPTFRPRLRRT